MIAIIILCGILIFGTLYMLKLAFENNVRYHELVLQGVEEHFWLFFISDIHLRKIHKQMIEKLPKPVEAVIIGGDLADSRTPISVIRENIRLLKSLGPVYFVWGNNDREVGEEKLRNLFLEEHVTIIDNGVAELRTKNRCKLVAIDDLTTGNPDVEKAFEKCQKEDHVFFVCHNPQIFPIIRETYRPKLLMGGHYHGGQIRLGPLGIFPKGYFKAENGSTTLISNGYGTTALPLRFGAKSECHIIDIIFQGQANNNSSEEWL